MTRMLLIGLLLAAPLFQAVGAETTVGPDLYPQTLSEATAERATEMIQVPDFAPTVDNDFETTPGDVFTSEDPTMSEEWTTDLNEPETTEQTSTQDTASTESAVHVTTLASQTSSPGAIEATTANAHNDTAVAQRQDSKETSLLAALIVVSVIAGVALIAVVILAVFLFRRRRPSPIEAIDMEPVNPQDIVTNHKNKKYVRWREFIGKDPPTTTEPREGRQDEDPTQSYFNMTTEMSENPQGDSNRASNVYMNYGESATSIQQTEDNIDQTGHEAEDTREVYANIANDSVGGGNVQGEDYFQDNEDYQNFKSAGR